MWPLCVIPCTDDTLNLLVSNWWTEGKFHFIFAKIKELHNNRTEFCLVRGCLGVIPSAETRNVLSILFLLNVALSLHILTVFQIPPTTVKQIKFRFTHGIGIHVRIIFHDKIICVMSVTAWEVSILRVLCNFRWTYSHYSHKKHLICRVGIVKQLLIWLRLSPKLCNDVAGIQTIGMWKQRGGLERES